MVKLTDFATQKGVSRQAIYKHLSNHRAELEGHYIKKGKNGTYLDDFACEYISNLMLEQPIAIVDTALQQQLEQLRQENTELLKALNMAQSTIISLKDEVSDTKLLLASAEHAAEKVESLEKELEKEKTRKIGFSEWLKRR